MRRDHARDERRRGGAAGFTLVELLVVLAIIGLIIALVLVAAADGVRRAEERATQGLIAKIEAGLSDRLDALLNAQAPVNQTHRYLAAINYSPDGTNFIPVGSVNSSGSDERRAQVIAQFDYIRSELPDVFFVNEKTSNGGSFASTYPINFGAPAYPDGSGLPYTPYYLPLGNLAPGLPYFNTSTYLMTTNPPQTAPLAATLTPPVTGIFGASFAAMGGLTKNLGYAPKGYDGVDNNGDGLIDDLSEGTPAGVSTTIFASQVSALLAKHTHKTARAEMLYAVLVEGLGPLGSVFNRDEFTSREVQDTDGDGLPEFVDAWGEPLQFFRWPIYFGTVAGASDTQMGSNAYTSGYSQVRQLDPLDPNQLLVSPSWWALVGNPRFSTGSNSVNPTFAPPNGAATGQSQAALAFMNHFHSLVDPFPMSSTGTSWDRTGSYARRSYYSRFLILSSGPDKEPGVGQLGKNYRDLADNETLTAAPFPDATKTMDQNTALLVFIENQAAQSDPQRRTGSFYEKPDPPDLNTSPSATTVYLQNNVGLDDVTNHNLQTPSSGVR